MAHNSETSTFEEDASGTLEGNFEVVTSLKGDEVTAMLVYQNPGKETLCVAQGVAELDFSRALRNLHDVTASIVSDVRDHMGFDAKGRRFVQFPGGVANFSMMQV